MLPIAIDRSSRFDYYIGERDTMHHNSGDNLIAKAEFEPLEGLNLSPHAPFSYAEFITRDSEGILFHIHYAMELGLITDGAMDRVSPNGRTALKTGDVWLTSPLEPHWWQVTKAETRIMVFHFAPEFLASIRFEEEPALSLMTPFTAPGAARPQSTPKTRSQFLDLAARARNLAPGPFRSVRLRLLLMEYLLLLQENWTPPQKPRGTVSFGRLAPAIKLVFRNSNYLSTAEAAKACNLSRKQFHHLFQQAMGISFAQFALRYRLSNAARELHQTKAPVKAIAERWGFADVSHFHRLFKELYLCSPAAYRAGAVSSPD
jgi:AraC-like DNA-binding protein